MCGPEVREGRPNPRAAGLTPAAQLQFDHITVGGDFTLRGVTIHQYFGPEHRDPDSRNRQAMIEKVWAIWITGLLQPSLPQDILLELGLTTPCHGRPHLGPLRAAPRPRRPGRHPVPGSSTSSTVWVVRCLSLGAPGAGKTTLLLTLAHDLLIRAAQDPATPSPWCFRCPPGPRGGDPWLTGWSMR